MCNTYSHAYLDRIGSADGSGPGGAGTSADAGIAKHLVLIMLMGGLVLENMQYLCGQFFAIPIYFTFGERSHPTEILIPSNAVPETYSCISITYQRSPALPAS